MFHRLFALVLFSPLNECFVNFYAKAESKTTPNLPIDALSVAVGGGVEFPCVKPSSWTHDSASWVRMTVEDAKRCEKGLKKIKDDHHWFCDVLVGNRIVQSDFSERFSIGSLGSAKKDYLTLKSATLEDSGRYYCFNNRTKEIVKLYSLSVYFVTTAAAQSSSHITADSRSSNSATSEDIELSGLSGLNGPSASVVVGAVCVVVVLVIIAVVVIIFIRKRRNANKEQRNFEEIEEPNYEEVAIEALNSNGNNEDNHYMELGRTQVNQPSVYETIALDRSEQSAAI